MLPGAFLLLLGASAAPVKPPVLVRYVVTERTKSLTPAGERIGALAGTVTVAGDKARWELRGSTFPRVAARVALLDGQSITLLDTDEKVAAPAPPGDLESIFRAPAAAEHGLGSFAVRDLALSVSRDGSGRVFQGRPTARWRVVISWDLSLANPGRMGRVHNEVRATVETAEELEDARSPFDGLSRLFPVRGEVREALETELSRLTGFPVMVSVDSISEGSWEPVSGEATGEADRPLRTSTSVTRTVSDLVRQPLREDDMQLFRVPDGYRTRGLERLLRADAALP